MFLKDDPEDTRLTTTRKNAPCAIRVHSFKVDEEEMVETQENGSRRNNNNNNRSVGSEKHNKVVVIVVLIVVIVAIVERRLLGVNRRGTHRNSQIVFDKEPEFEAIGGSVYLGFSPQ